MASFIQNMYGVDWDGPIPILDECDHNIVTVPPTIRPLSANESQELQLAINPLSESADHGIDIFLQCICFI